MTFVGENGKTYIISGCDNVRIKLASLVKSPRFDILSGGLSLYVNDGETVSYTHLQESRKKVSLVFFCEVK